MGTDDKDKGSSSLNVVEFESTRKIGKAEGEAEAKRGFTANVKVIRQMFALPAYQSAPFQELKDELIERCSTPDEAREALLNLIGGNTEPLTAEFRQDAKDDTVQRDMGKRHTVQHGKEDSDKFSEGMQRALEVRIGIEKDAEKVSEVNQHEFSGMNMTELAREFCRRNQIGMAGKNREQVIGLALTRAVVGHGTSDFANVLENVMNKSLLAGWTETEETWQTWCRVGTLPDFKQGSRTNVSAFSDLEVVYENGEYKYGTFSDLKETIQLITYGKLFNISRQALANDDLNSLSLIPRAMGRAANRTVGDQAYNLLTQASGLGPTLNQDATALFDAAGHSNYYTGAGAPTVATVNTMLTAMATQTDPSGNAILNIRPKYLLVPYALRATAEVLMNSTLNPAEGSTTSFTEPNSVQNVAQVVVDGRLDSASTTAWYMLADQNMHDTAEIAFLNGQSTPYTESREGWTIDGTEFKVRIDAAAAALDFRGMQKHAGA